MRTAGKLLSSFSYAFSGLRAAYASQLNMRIHMWTAAVVSILTLLLPLTVAEMLFIIAAVYAVIVCELANTALEAAVDLASPQRHPLARIAKDTAAAAVMVSAFFAIVIGLVIFGPLILELFREGWHTQLAISLPSMLVALAILGLSVTACVGNSSRGYPNHYRDLQLDERQEWTFMLEKQENVIDYTSLHSDERELLDMARLARERAYVPYSQFRVGSAVLTQDGHIYEGCNIENAAYGSTNCAERSALFHAISRGAVPRQFRMLAVIGATEQPITPCGACRQVIAELCGPEMPILLANMEGKVLRTTIAELLPGMFDEQALNSDEARGKGERS